MEDENTTSGEHYQPRLAVEDDADDEKDEEGGGGGARADVKSNNPHLTGGEKLSQENAPRQHAGLQETRLHTASLSQTGREAASEREHVRRLLRGRLGRWKVPGQTDRL